MTRGMLSNQWLKFLHQTLHNDKWRHRHTDITKFESTPGWTDTHTTRQRRHKHVHPAHEPCPPDDEPAEPVSEESIRPDTSKGTVLESTLPPATDTTILPQTIDPIIFLAGLIKVLWIELATLWRSHLALIHENAKAAVSPVTLAETHIRVQTLYSLKTSTLPVHRTETYFPPDLPIFLAQSSLHQLQN